MDVSYFNLLFSTECKKAYADSIIKGELKIFYFISIKSVNKIKSRAINF